MRLLTFSLIDFAFVWLSGYFLLILLVIPGCLCGLICGFFQHRAGMPARGALCFFLWLLFGGLLGSLLAYLCRNIRWLLCCFWRLFVLLVILGGLSRTVWLEYLPRPFGALPASSLLFLFSAFAFVSLSDFFFTCFAGADGIECGVVWGFFQ